MTTSQLSSINVLLVDDDQFSLNFTKRLLDKIGIGQVCSTMSVEEALEFLKTSEVPVQVVIADINMPEQDGFALVRRIRYGEVEKYRHIPVVMLTGKDTVRNLRRGGIHKINGFLVKPPKKDELRDQIVKAITG